jgi:hypothetical protein
MIRKHYLLALLSAMVASAPSIPVGAVEFGGVSSVLPAGTELGDEAFEQPRELFRSESGGGRKSYLVNLGDAAFNSPLILGGAARQAGISCNTCHVNGTSNPRLYIPGLSTRAGTFDTTGHLFNPKSDNGVLDPLTIPSLRGAHLLAPYGHDGRTLSLPDFVRNVIVNEFAGPEPSREILDALVVYIEDIDFVPNRRLGTAGKLQGNLTDSEKRGEALFYRPFVHNPDLSCAACHVPTAAFVDHRQHDVGSGGVFKTPTLLNANFNAPYFHDGRYSSYAQVVSYFNRTFYLDLSLQDRQDLVAYLTAVGDGEQAVVTDSMAARTKEITDFLSAVEIAGPERRTGVVEVILDAVDRDVRELAEQYPERKDPSVGGGAEQRAKARAVLRELVLSLREMDNDMHAGRFDAVSLGLSHARELLTAAVPSLEAAEPWSLFNRRIHDEHYAAIRRLYGNAIDPALTPRPRIDLD